MKKVILTAALLCLAGSAFAQAQPQAPPTLEQAMQRSWTAVMTKLVAIAKDLPEAQWDYRPAKEARSALEELWHTMASMQAAAARAKGQALDRPALQKLFSNEGKPRVRAEIVATMETAAKEINDAMGVKADPAMIGGIEHLGEHYGKLVTMYRANGLVPPNSRPRE